MNPLDQLAALIRSERDALLARWRQQVRELPSAQHLDVPTLNDHVPQLIDELTAALKALQALKVGNIGLKGATGILLEENLVKLRDLIDRSLPEIRLATGMTTAPKAGQVS